MAATVACHDKQKNSDGSDWCRLTQPGQPEKQHRLKTLYLKTIDEGGDTRRWRQQLFAHDRNVLGVRDLVGEQA